jgi:hypothetical protein
LEGNPINNRYVLVLVKFSAYSPNLDSS